MESSPAPANLNMLIVALGSIGDIYPNVAIGRRLREHGHHVTIFANGYFEPLVRRLGMDFEEVGTVEEYLEITSNPDIWNPLKFGKVLAPKMIAGTRLVYEKIAGRHVSGKTLIVTPCTAFGARIAQEKLGIPLVIAHAAPAFLNGLADSIWFPGRECRGWLCRLVRRRLGEGIDDWGTDRLLGPPTNTFRTELGLQPARRLFHEWMRPPTNVIGLFPEWFLPQQDLPRGTSLTGFPLSDFGEFHSIPDEVSEFLDAGDPPVVVRASSGMRHVDRFFAIASDAIRRLGKRGLLLTAFPDQAPPRLPAGIRQFGYVPFGPLLSRAAALIHHGGIGTISQALAAGVPQLIVPQNFDQPFNAYRVSRLGIGNSIHPFVYRAGAVLRKLRMLMESETVARNCRNFGAKVREADAVGEACRLIEGVMEPAAGRAAGTAQSGRK